MGLEHFSLKKKFRYLSQNVISDSLLQTDRGIGICTSYKWQTKKSEIVYTKIHRLFTWETLTCYSEASNISQPGRSPPCFSEAYNKTRKRLTAAQACRRCAYGRTGATERAPRPSALHVVLF